MLKIIQLSRLSGVNVYNSEVNVLACYVRVQSDFSPLLWVKLLLDL